MLQRLNLTDQQVCETAVRACRGWSRGGVSEELCEAVVNETYARLLRRLRDDPTRDYFAEPEKLLSYVYTVAYNAYGADIRDRKRAVEVTPLGSGDPVARAEGETSRGEMLSRLTDCDRACRECLSDADEEVRRVFLMKCEGAHAAGVMPTGRDIAARLGVSEATASRLWKLARWHFRRRCGAELNDNGSDGE